MPTPKHPRPLLTAADKAKLEDAREKRELDRLTQQRKDELDWHRRCQEEQQAREAAERDREANRVRKAWEVDKWREETRQTRQQELQERLRQIHGKEPNHRIVPANKGAAIQTQQPLEKKRAHKKEPEPEEGCVGEREDSELEPKTQESSGVSGRLSQKGLPSSRDRINKDSRQEDAGEGKDSKQNQAKKKPAHEPEEHQEKLKVEPKRSKSKDCLQRKACNRGISGDRIAHKANIRAPNSLAPNLPAPNTHTSNTHTSNTSIPNTRTPKVRAPRSISGGPRTVSNAPSPNTRTPTVRAPRSASNGPSGHYWQWRDEKTLETITQIPMG